MALSDLAVYSETAYKTSTEILRQKIDLFNAATGGAILLRLAALQGDYSDEAFYAKISGLVRRRNAYGTGTVTEKALEMLEATMVKVGAGTPPVRIDPGMFRWIQKSPQEAGFVLGQQLAGDMLADMLNTALGVAVAAMGSISAITHNISGLTDPADDISYSALNDAQAKFGDASSDIQVWISHSAAMHKLWGTAIANEAGLFSYSTVNVKRDPFGKLFVMTDSSSLVASTVYSTLGLVPGAILLEQNNDFDANEETKNGNENIIRTYQAEWSFNMGMKGFAWDKSNGGKSPTDAALLTATNWDRYATSEKDLPGVILKSHV